MKIAYISASIIPSETADSVHVMKMCEALAQADNIVKLQGIEGTENNNTSPFDYYDVSENFEVDLRKGGKKHLSDRIFAIIKNACEADLVYTRYAIAAFISAIILRKRTVYEYHLMMDRKYNNIIEKCLIKSTYTRHVFITGALLNAYRKKYPILSLEKSIVLPDGANDPHISLEMEKKKKLACGYIGSFAPGKGIELVIRIAALLPDVVFHVVGGRTEEIEKLRQTSTSNIIWYGYLKQSEAMNVLKKYIDIALLPNQKKMYVGNGYGNGYVDIGAFTSPMKLFEYMAYGKAILASKIPVLEEIVSDGKNAITVDPSNANEWAKEITNLIQNNELYEKIRLNAYYDFKSKYTWLQRAKNVNLLIDEWE